MKGNVKGTWEPLKELPKEKWEQFEQQNKMVCGRGDRDGEHM